MGGCNMLFPKPQSIEKTSGKHELKRAYNVNLQEFYKLVKEGCDDITVKTEAKLEMEEYELNITETGR